ncbi:MAG: VWA domain-containing protein [Thermoanaerobaculia bacterium]|nr:VWA domain-containing protein [Thermoanaerobaculia bacterium]
MFRSLDRTIAFPSSLLGVLLLALPAGTAVSQENASSPAEDVVFGEVVDVRVINIDVYVTGRDGEPVVGLGREDFKLEVDGDPVPITNFHAEVEGAVRESIQPIERQPMPIERDSDSTFRTLEEIRGDPARRAHVAILVDQTRLGTANRKRAFEAVREALSGFDPDDLVSVVSLSGSLIFHSDFLFDRKAVGEILDELEEGSRGPDLAETERNDVYGQLSRGMSGGILAPMSSVSPQEITARIRAYAAEEYQRSITSLRALDSVVSTMAGAPGRKVVLYVGEGIPNRPGEGMYEAWVNRFGSGTPEDAGMPSFDYTRDYRREIGNFELEPVMEQVASRANDARVTIYAVDAEEDHGGEIRSALTEQGAWSESVSVVTENYRVPRVHDAGHRRQAATSIGQPRPAAE